MNCVTDTLVTAVEYARRGWSVVPIPHRAKNPGFIGWQQLRLCAADLGRHFNGRQQNIGVLLGEPSGWLIDVDLDHLLAVKLADRFLPPTSAVFGRRGKPRSHWLYYSTGTVATRQWRLSKDRGRQMLLELRSTGSQTVFPGSVHSSGEPVQWDCDGEPTRIEPSALSARIQALCLAVHEHLGLPIETSSPVGQAYPDAIPTFVMDRARKYLAKLPAAVSGQGGHNATFRAACVLVMGFGLDRERASALLSEWNERCKPPWSAKALEHKIDDAMKAPGWRGRLLAWGNRPIVTRGPNAIERANRHAIEHRRRARRRSRV